MKKDKKIGLWHYINKYKWGFILHTIIYLIASVGSVFATIYLANAVEDLTTNLYNKAIIDLLIVLGFIVLNRIAWYLSTIIFKKYSLKIMAELSIDLSNRVLLLNSKTYADNGTGTFVQRIINDPERILTNLSDLIEIVFGIITSLIIYVYILTLNFSIGLIVVGVSIIALVLENYRVKIRKKNRYALREKNDKLHSFETEIIKSEKDIKSLGLEDKLQDLSKTAYLEYSMDTYKAEVTNVNFYSLRRALLEISAIGILILGILMVEKSLLTISAFMILYSNHSNMHSLIWGIGKLADKGADIKNSTKRMFSIFNEVEFASQKYGDKTINDVKGDIEFKNVDFSYCEYKYIEDEKIKQNKKELVSKNQVLKNINFKIEKNSTVAFVGKSGSGKSTIIYLIDKLYEVDKGQVLIDGTNINEFTKESIKNSIAVVNQFPYVFNMSIKGNLQLVKKDATDAEINKALELANLKEFVNSLPNGIKTVIGENGVKLSGGQKQRIAIARALIKDTPIIVFDESTSSLDNMAQEEIKRSIEKLKGKKTIILVSHRLSTIKNADKIFLLKDGTINESGTIKEISKNQDFLELFNIEK